MALRSLVTGIGRAVRETGQALDRLGCTIQGNMVAREGLSRHRRISPLYDLKPQIGVDTFIAPSASVVGNVSLGSKTSVWYNTVIRAERDAISIGENSSIGDHATIVADKGPATLGQSVTVGNGCTLVSCTIEDRASVQLGAVVQSGAVVETEAVVSAGSVVESDTTVPTGQLWAGNPAQFVRALTEQERASLPVAAENFYKLGREHLEQHERTNKEFDEQMHPELYRQGEVDAEFFFLSFLYLHAIILLSLFSRLTYAIVLVFASR
eukprot:CAMPEP_0177677946 /NCGR_PEP_ID=MMETSP0447-20121125/28717_1 /TAXON_ID=0 /ORGANISM="Stygamoeba regulata, Strain BSH-02190019" /LENGTH=266 /DNA_ID=CAMNT_0019186857 /DNA_START=238 /DNA_END=1035 /DNA_ORIENTATION=+